MRPPLPRPRRHPGDAHRGGGAAALGETDLWTLRAAAFARLSDADAIAVIVPLEGVLIQYASWGISGSIVSLPDLAPAVREIIAGTMAGTVASVNVPLADGRRAGRAMLRPLGWDGRSVGAIVALRSARTFLAEDASTLDEVARLAAIDLFASYARPRPSGAPPATAAPPAAAGASAVVAPLPAARALGPGTVLAATVVAQTLAADGAIALQRAGAASSVDAATGWLALALAAAAQGLALLSLRHRWPARPLLALLLLVFVATAMSVPLVTERPLILGLRVGEAIASLAAALLVAGRLRDPAAHRP